MADKVIKDNVIFHIDVNSAFLSWTAVKLLKEGYPVDLREVPSIIGGDQESRHGIVVAKSIPAKKYGIKTADTVASALSACPSLVVVPPEHNYYREQSKLLMEHLRSFCPVIEQVSVDECYMDYEPIKEKYESPETAANIIKDSVREKFGFTVNVGISNKKVLAKMASDFRKPDLVHTLYDYEIKEKMWPLPIGDLFMCGKSSANFLRGRGINTIGDLANTDVKLVESWLKSHGRMLHNFANGIDNSRVEPIREAAKGVGNSTTLSSDIVLESEAFNILRELSNSVAKRLNKQQKLAGQVSIEIKYSDFKSVSHQTTIPSPTFDSKEIYETSCELFRELWNGNPIRLLGVRTTKLSDVNEPVQMDIFSYQRVKEKNDKQRKADEAMNSIKNKFGDGAISKGSEFINS